MRGEIRMSRARHTIVGGREQVGRSAYGRPVYGYRLRCSCGWTHGPRWETKRDAEAVGRLHLEAEAARLARRPAPGATYEELRDPEPEPW